MKEKFSKLLNFSLRPEIVFVIMGLFFGFIFVFVTPPFQVPDEGTHFKRAYQISTGQFISEKKDNLVGGFIPLSINELEGYFMRFTDKNIKISYKEIVNKLTVRLEPFNTTFGSFPNTALYSPVPYLPQTIGMFVGRVFDLPTLWILYIGRILNLLVWVFLVYYAIRITPVLKWIFLLLALMPMTVYQSASLSADAIVVGLSFLFTALLLSYLVTKKTLALKQILLLFVLAILITLSKQTYFTIPLMFFLLPLKIFPSAKNYWRTIGLFIFVVMATFLGWSCLVNKLYIPLQTYVDPNAQLSHILHDPLSYTKFVTYYTISWFSGLDPRSVIGHLGWLDTYLPLWMISAYKIILIFTFLMETKKIKLFNNIQRIVTWTILVLTALLIVTVMYLTWNPIGSTKIEGIQGRYFIPLLPLLFIALYSDYFKTSKRLNPKYFVPIFTFMILAETVRILIYRFYI